ncbi:MAG: hypothetical protein SFY56_00515 [Bacteroidota bacterium]|nr:hypothetical protein [Bacteroidota bacterium]
MIRKLWIFITLILSWFSFVGHKSLQKEKAAKKYSNPFDTLKYDKVIAYDYNGSPEMQIVTNGQVIPIKNRIFKQSELTKEQLKKFNKTLGNTKSYGEGTAACFDPHFGIVYYNQNKIVGYISVCLSCNYLISFPKIPAQNSHKTDLCDECYAYGFSKYGRKNISELVKELNFDHWQLNSELFDK